MRQQPAFKSDAPDAVEAVRRLVWEAYFEHMHFHEIAIEDPFKAERILQDLCSSVLSLIGFPGDVRVFVREDDEQDAA